MVSYVRYLTSAQPQSAIRWAETIGNDRNRQMQLEAAAGSWMRSDAASASAWINGSELSDDVKKRLLGQK